MFIACVVEVTSYVHSISPNFSVLLSSLSVVFESPPLFDRISKIITKKINKTQAATPINICFFNFANLSSFNFYCFLNLININEI